MAQQKGRRPREKLSCIVAIWEKMLIELGYAVLKEPEKFMASQSGGFACPFSVSEKF